MDILKAEIAKKRKQLEDKALVTNERKFFKREELEQKQNEEYWKRQQEKQREKLSKSEAKTGEDALECFTGKSSEEITKMKLKQMITSSQTSESDASTSDDTRILPRKEVIKRLRDRCQPILTFGETEVDAFKRLRRLEILEPDSSLKGMTNDFQVSLKFCILFIMLFYRKLWRKSMLLIWSKWSNQMAAVLVKRKEVLTM